MIKLIKFGSKSLLNFVNLILNSCKKEINALINYHWCF